MFEPVRYTPIIRPPTEKKPMLNQKKGKPAMTDDNNHLKGRKPTPEPRPRPEPRTMNIDPATFAQVVQSLHTLTQSLTVTQPIMVQDLQELRQMVFELGSSIAGLNEDIAAIAIAVGVRPGPLVLQQPMQPQGQGQATRPSPEQLAQTLRSLPGVGPEDKRDFDVRAGRLPRTPEASSKR
jgi:hypothetical protein